MKNTSICLIKKAAPSVIDSGQANKPAEGAYRYTFIN